MINTLDKVKLKNGNVGYVSEKLDDTHFYVDISQPTGEISTIFIRLDEIASVFVETEHAIIA